MPIEGVDYSFGRPDPADLARAGKRFALRYVSWASSGRGVSVLNGGSNGKVITRAEVLRLLAAGLSIVTNWEFRTDDQLRGRSGGREDAREAERIHRAVGGPSDRPIYFSTDFDASTSQLATCFEYLRGCADVLGWDRVGVYGGRRTILYMQDRDVKWLWQTYAWSGISNRFNPEDPRWVDGAQLHQYNNGVQVAGADTDLDRAMTADYGQWGQEEVVTPEDIKKVAAAVWEHMLEVPDWMMERWGESWPAGQFKAGSIHASGYGHTRSGNERTAATSDELAALQGQIAGLTALVQQLLTAPPVDITPEALADIVAQTTAAAREGAARALEAARIDVPDGV